MKIQVLSDIHVEMKPFTLKVNPEADVLVLAGDIVVLENQGKKLYHLENLIKNVEIPIVYIIGNHENYGFGRISDNNKLIKLLESKYPNFHFLNDETWVYKDVEFIGSTLWSNFDLAEDKMFFVERVEYAINDFNLILSENTGRITPREMIGMNLKAREFINKAVRKKNGFKKVVVTHFVPTPLGIAEQYKGNALNPYFVCNCEDLMPGVHTWIFGHTHSSFDFMINKVHSSGHVLVNTHMVCNPRGYDKENKGTFDSQKIIEV
jgi:predicted phosphodiesterase